MNSPARAATPPTALEALARDLGPGAERDLPLAPFTAMQVGGPADLLTVAESSEELVRAAEAARRRGVPFRVVGSGCNVLVADRGLRGLVIVNRAAAVSFQESSVRAESGARLAAVARSAVERSMAGLVWATGLPGTVGGAVVGNAGAFGGDVSGSLSSGTLLEPDGEVVERQHGWFEFEYRGSRLKGDGGDGSVVLAATFRLEPGDRTTLEAQAEELRTWRVERHPSRATMGSTFKNPPGRPAGRLIEQAGLKGARVGGARVSKQHANFLINDGSATARDVLALIERVRAEVERQFGVELELEIELLGWS